MSTRCAHESCTCTVEAEGTYCSEACRKAAGQSAHSEECTCGHDGCGAPTASRS